MLLDELKENNIVEEQAPVIATMVVESLVSGTRMADTVQLANQEETLSALER